MKKTREESILLPVECQKLKKKEMLEVEGGKQIWVNRKYLKQENCKDTARKLLMTGEVKNMSIIQVAQEIYAHAWAFYGSSVLLQNGISNDCIKEIFSRTGRIDIEDGGDTAARQAIYSAVWNIGALAGAVV